MTIEELKETQKYFEDNRAFFESLKERFKTKMYDLHKTDEEAFYFFDSERERFNRIYSSFTNIIFEITSIECAIKRKIDDKEAAAKEKGE